jgi:hypothetical protein
LKWLFFACFQVSASERLLAVGSVSFFPAWRYFPLLFALPDAPLLCTNGQAGADLVA